MNAEIRYDNGAGNHEIYVDGQRCARVLPEGMDQARSLVAAASPPKKKPTRKKSAKKK